MVSGSFDLWKRRQKMGTLDVQSSTRDVSSRKPEPTRETHVAREPPLLGALRAVRQINEREAQRNPVHQQFREATEERRRKLEMEDRALVRRWDRLSEEAQRQEREFQAELREASARFPDRATKPTVGIPYLGVPAALSVRVDPRIVRREVTIAVKYGGIALSEHFELASMD